MKTDTAPNAGRDDVLGTAPAPPLRASPFTSPWWCRHAHAQTLWPTLFRRSPRVPLTRERVELPDGDFLDLDWFTTNSHGPIVLVLHGLEGSSESKYALGLLKSVAALGWRGAILNFRGCSGEPNRLPRGYHSGDTGDIAHVVGLLKQRTPQTKLAVVGYSLGGNAMLKWLGEIGDAAPIAAAAAVSPPFLLAECAWRMERGFSQLYQRHLVSRLRSSVDAKRRRMPLPLKLSNLSTLRTFREFDDQVTAPLHGFAGVDDYYARSSSRQYLRHIRVPTLILHSRDDPFMTEAAIPSLHELSPTIEFELQNHGGHVGFVGGRWPWKPDYWLERRIPDFLCRHL